MSIQDIRMSEHTSAVLGHLSERTLSHSDTPEHHTNLPSHTVVYHSIYDRIELEPSSCAPPLAPPSLRLLTTPPPTPRNLKPSSTAATLASWNTNNTIRPLRTTIYDRSSNSNTRSITIPLDLSKSATKAFYNLRSNSTNQIGASTDEIGRSTADRTNTVDPRPKRNSKIQPRGRTIPYLNSLAALDDLHQLDRAQNRLQSALQLQQK